MPIKSKMQINRKCQYDLNKLYDSWQEDFQKFSTDVLCEGAITCNWPGAKVRINFVHEHKTIMQHTKYLSTIVITCSSWLEHFQSFLFNLSWQPEFIRNKIFVLITVFTSFNRSKPKVWKYWKRWSGSIISLSCKIYPI